MKKVSIVFGLGFLNFFFNNREAQAKSGARTFELPVVDAQKIILQTLERHGIKVVRNDDTLIQTVQISEHDPKEIIQDIMEYMGVVAATSA